MATATPSPAPNPDAMKFTLDVTLSGRLNFKSAAEATGHPFAEQVFGIEGVEALFGTGDFVTVTRRPDMPWDPIIEGVQAAAASHL